MTDVLYSTEEFQRLVQPLIGLPVSLPWKGYGSAIFLELGVLTAPKSPRLSKSNGEAGINVYWDWRVEFETKIAFGSSDSGPMIAEGISGLQGEKVESLAVEGQVPELVVGFSAGLHLRSMRMGRGQPQWAILLPDGNYVGARKGQLYVGKGTMEISQEEADAYNLATLTVKRWGDAISEPKKGSCRDCNSFVRIDGHGAFLDYGVCVSESSPFDGRAVSGGSGCPSFIAE